MSAVVAAMLAISAAGVSNAADTSSSAPELREHLPSAEDDARISGGGHNLFSMPLTRLDAHGAWHAAVGDLAADLETEAPALVPLAPPVWAGLAMLTAMAFIRTCQRRRYRRLRMSQTL